LDPEQQNVEYDVEPGLTWQCRAVDWPVKVNGAPTLMVLGAGNGGSAMS
jgi:hypothetical protein